VRELMYSEVNRAERDAKKQKCRLFPDREQAALVF